jgi:hypothetical protein
MTTEPNVQLVRVVMDNEDYGDYAASVSFTDVDGKMVSLAFDGRHESEAYGIRGERFEYGTYSDCPIFDGAGVAHHDSTPLAVMRNLRNALINLNLGD